MKVDHPVARTGEIRSQPIGLRVPAAAQALLSRRAAACLALGGVAAASVAGWVGVMSTVDPLAMTDLGLLPATPPAALGFFLLLAASFVAALRMQPVPQVLLGVHVISAIFMLYGAPMLFEDAPRFVTGWLHVGFVDAIARTGELFPNRDARFDWPGFFVLFAFLQNAVGGADLLAVLPWAHVVQMGLYLAPLYLIARSATGDLRLVWLTLWVFVLTNWVGQDYFSPQGMNLFLMLTVVAILLTWFRVRPSQSGWVSAIASRIGAPGVGRAVVDPDGGTDDGPEPRLDDRQQIGLIVILVLLFGLSVASHQLTPFAIIGGVTLLALAGRLRLRGVWAVMVVLGTTWLMFMATTFLDGRVGALLAEVGRPDQFAASNVAGRLQGSPGHLLVVQGRVVFSLAIWLVAFIGGLRRLRGGRLDLSLALLAIAPFGLILAQGYGGEMVLRVFLFALPFMSFFAAAAVFPTLRPASAGRSVALLGLSAILAVGFFFTRYGNEKADLVTQDDYGALQFLGRVAEPGSVIATPNSGAAPEFIAFEQHRYPDLYQYMGSATLGEDELDEMFQALADLGDPGDEQYVLVTNGARGHAALLWSMSDAEWERRMAMLDSRMDVLYRQGTSIVFGWTVPEPAPRP